MSVTNRRARSIAGEHLRHRRNIAAGEDVFLDPGVGRARRIAASDRVQQHHAVVLQQSGDMGEIFVEARRADMLEHADRDDPVERPLDVAIVLQTEPGAVVEACVPRALLGDARAAPPTSVTPVTRAPAVWRRYSPMPPNPQPMSSALWRSSISSLAAMWRFLASCASSRRLARALEIGAGILPVGVQEQVVEPVIEIVVAGDVAPGATPVVALVVVAQRDRGFSRASRPIAGAWPAARLRAPRASTS